MIRRSQLLADPPRGGVRFQHHKTWKASPDPEFEAKKNRILDLYAHPPKGARVLCLLQRRLGHGRQPIRHPVRLRATYERTQGVRHLLAADDPSDGTILGHLRDHKTWQETRELLEALRARFSLIFPRWCLTQVDRFRSGVMVASVTTSAPTCRHEEWDRV